MALFGNQPDDPLSLTLSDPLPVPGNNPPTVPRPPGGPPRIPPWSSLNIPPMLQQLIARRAGLPTWNAARPPERPAGWPSQSLYPQFQSALAAHPEILSGQYGPRIAAQPWWANFQNWSAANPTPPNPLSDFHVNMQPGGV